MHSFTLMGNGPNLGRRECLSTLTGMAATALWPMSLSSVVRGSDARPSTRIKIGQIGTKHPHASKLDVYRKSADYEVVGIVEPDLQRRAEVAQQAMYQGLPWMTQDELLAVPGLQAVLIETDLPDLLTSAETCIAAGKHVHLDKPAGSSFTHFQRVMAAAQRQQLLVQMGYMYRYNPGIVLLKELLEAGWLGEIFEVHAVMSKVVGAAERKVLARYPGGMMFELGGHLIDLVVGLLGRPTEITSILQHVSSLDDGLMDNTLAIFTYPKASATIRTSGVEVNGGDRRHLTVCGTMGTFHIQPLDNPRVRIALDRPRGMYVRGFQDIALPPYARYVDDAAEMARILRGESDNRFSYDHDLTVQEALLKSSGMLG